MIDELITIQGKKENEGNFLQLILKNKNVPNTAISRCWPSYTTNNIPENAIPARKVDIVVRVKYTS